MENINTNGKMKITGYCCIAFAAILSMLSVVKIVDSTISLPLVSTWITTGVGLLMGNAAKHTVGKHLQAKQQKEM